jgi:hypothetical protein
MIEPTEADIGRKVVYRSFPNAEPEEGTITAMAKQSGQPDPRFVFVAYPRSPNSQLTPCTKLEWMAPADTFGFDEDHSVEHRPNRRGSIKRRRLMAWEPGTLTNRGAIRGREPNRYLRSGVVYMLQSDLQEAMRHGWNLRSYMDGGLAMVERKWTPAANNPKEEME